MFTSAIDTVFTSNGDAVIVERDFNKIRLCVGGVVEELTREEARLLASKLRIAANTESI